MADPYLFIRACEQTRLIVFHSSEELFDSADVGSGALTAATAIVAGTSDASHRASTSIECEKERETERERGGGKARERERERVRVGRG